MSSIVSGSNWLQLMSALCLLCWVVQYNYTNLKCVCVCVCVCVCMLHTQCMYVRAVMSIDMYVHRGADNTVPNSLSLSLTHTGKTENLKLVHAINNALDIAMESDSTAGQPPF